MIILASTSLTRQTLLNNAGLGFRAVAPQLHERQLVLENPHWQPHEVALKLAEAKALDVSKRHKDAIVIGADQVLTLGAKIYSKPRDAADCRDQLMELRGKTHILMSAVACARSGEITWSHRDEAALRMRNFSSGFLDDYLERIAGDCTSSVGGYKIEGIGIQLFSEVKGDHFTILGLPLTALLSYLRETGEIPS